MHIWYGRRCTRCVVARSICRLIFSFVQKKILCKSGKRHYESYTNYFPTHSVPVYLLCSEKTTKRKPPHLMLSSVGVAPSTNFEKSTRWTQVGLFRLERFVAYGLRSKVARREPRYAVAVQVVVRIPARNRC